MQKAIFAVSGMLIATVYTNAPESMSNSAQTFALSLGMLAASFAVHSTIYDYGKTNYPDRSEHERIRTRSLWILFGLAALVSANLIDGTGDNGTWAIAFLFLTGMTIWELMYYLIGDAPATDKLKTGRKQHE